MADVGHKMGQVHALQQLREIPNVKCPTEMTLEELNFWSSFAKGFKKGFGMVMKPAAAVFGAVGKVTGQPEISAAGSIFSGLNKGVSMIPSKRLQLQQLGFWNDFQRGFGMVMKPAAQIASGIGSAMGGNSEYGQMASQAGNIFNGINNGVQGTQFQ